MKTSLNDKLKNWLNFTEVSLYILNRLSTEHLECNSNKYVISLTSYPSRIDKVYKTIESLFKQTIKPDVIHIWLSKEEFPNMKLPNSLHRLRKRGVMIDFVEGNIKSYKKLYYSLSKYNNYCIITVDDDIIYPYKWLENLVKKNIEFPKDIICYRGHNLKKLDNKNLLPYNEIIKNSVFNINDGFDILPTGVSGVLYPPNSFTDEVFNIDLFMRLCPTNDDIWFKCCSLLKKTNVRRVYSKNLHFSIIAGSQKKSLYYTNVVLKHNDVQLKRTFDYFDLYKFISFK